MDYKKEIEKVLLSLKEKGMSRSDIEKSLYRSANWIDQTLARGGNEKALRLLQELDKKNVSTSIVSDSDSVYHSKYLQQLEDQVQFLKGVLVSNLGNMSVGQQHLRALAVAQLNQIAKLRAKDEGKPVSKVMAEINKEVADAALSIEQMDILSDIQDKKVKS